MVQTVMCLNTVMTTNEQDRQVGRGSIHPDQKGENITKTVILAVAVAALAALLLVGCQEGGLQRTIFSKGERNSHTCPN